ncbi:hypothetical protein CPLU01_01644 [Colletotrichum plurivorum]|uniref:Uncharacterized protein n=1 Tax=Colletotrichum plurivorum TaxID=2175906 RepID=A0A8H6KY08_9PEZI|nr:hypothetical protein CPLU01_01644 [Colletotrichum plurivorum]
MSSGLVAPLDEQRSLLGRSPTRPALHHGAAMGRAFISSGGATFRPARGRAAAARLLWLAKVHVGVSYARTRGAYGTQLPDFAHHGMFVARDLRQMNRQLLTGRRGGVSGRANSDVHSAGEELNLAIKGAGESPSKYFPAARLRGLAFLLLRRTVEQGGWGEDGYANGTSRSNRARREEVAVKQPSSQLDKPRRNPPCVKTGVHGPYVCVLFLRAAADVQDAAGKAAFVDPAPSADEVVSYCVPCNNSEAQ